MDFLVVVFDVDVDLLVDFEVDVFVVLLLLVFVVLVVLDVVDVGGGVTGVDDVELVGGAVVTGGEGSLVRHPDPKSGWHPSPQ